MDPGRRDNSYQEIWSILPKIRFRLMSPYLALLHILDLSHVEVNSVGREGLGRFVVGDYPEKLPMGIYNNPPHRFLALAFRKQAAALDVNMLHSPDVLWLGSQLDRAPPFHHLDHRIFDLAQR